MKLSPVQRICAALLFLASVFTVFGYTPNPQAVAVAPVTTTVVLLPPPRVVLMSAPAKPPWYAPVIRLPDQPVIVCILHNESRSTYAHPNMGDNNDPYQYGVFQFGPVLWNAWAWKAGVGHRAPGWFNGSSALHAVTVAAYQSNLAQQARVFAYIVLHDGTWPWTGHDGWAGDGC